ncbi:hypothetical protein PVT67_10765 [Gallaecimonas kandeliae]|nr:hypothetical protein [Gallaecimonas kandeliae]WKE64176.1 hypothetical protein PVT67_10765 [Gallaecimonas kandeliae]
MFNVILLSTLLNFFSGQVTTSGNDPVQLKSSAGIQVTATAMTDEEVGI